MSGALSTARLCMVRHLKNTSDNTSLFLSICFPKMFIYAINNDFCGIPMSGL